MNYISVQQVSKSYGERILFEDISFGINKGQKIAFIAKNGSGKTSLLDIIYGKDIPNMGEITKRKNLRISYLSQKDTFDENLTIEEVIFKGNNPMVDAINNYKEAIENPNDTDNYNKALEKMEDLDAWNFENEYKQILFKLKLDDLSQKVSNLSGGQKKRLSLASVLIEKVDFLILDEPTNHLDLEMIEWLENYLKSDNITLLMVTHDRYFLDRVCNEIIELDHKNIFKYKGNYSYFLEKRNDRIENEQIVVSKAKSLYKNELEWIRRQPKARTTKSKSRIDDFDIIKQKAHQRRNDHEVQLEINVPRLGNKILELHNISKSFGDKNLIDKFSYNFKKGERIGIIGKNGTGKSTFLNVITEKENLDSGKVIWGETVRLGYYTQKGIDIKTGQKIIDVVKKYGEFIELKKGKKISVSQLLERFLFDKKKQYDYVENLSGGELKRLYLCTILIKNTNFLIFDEPTNDLDIVTMNVLEQFLLDFPANIIVVTHDRYFMDKVVDSLFIFNGKGEVKNFPGNYSDFRDYESSIVKEETTKKEVNQSNLNHKENKKINNLENSIKKLTQKKEELEKLFNSNELSEEEISKNSEEIKKVITEIEKKEEEWVSLMENL